MRSNLDSANAELHSAPSHTELRRLQASAASVEPLRLKLQAAKASLVASESGAATLKAKLEESTSAVSLLHNERESLEFKVASLKRDVKSARRLSSEASTNAGEKEIRRSMATLFACR